MWPFKRKRKTTLIDRIISHILEAGEGFRDGRTARGNQYQFTKVFFPHLTSGTLWELVRLVRRLPGLGRGNEYWGEVNALRRYMGALV